MEKKPQITPTEKREYYSAGQFSIRESEDKGKTIEGVAIVTEQETVLWEGSDYREIEVIAQSCIAPDFIAKQDEWASKNKPVTTAPKVTKAQS